MKQPLKVLSIRVPPDVLERLPAPSLTGERAEYIRTAIEEKLDRDRLRETRKKALENE